MSKTLAKLPTIAVTPRLSVEDGAPLGGRGRVVGMANRALRELVSGARTPSGLWVRIVQALETEAARFGKDNRHCVARILSACAMELFAEPSEESTSRASRTGGSR